MNFTGTSKYGVSGSADRILRAWIKSNGIQNGNSSFKSAVKLSLSLSAPVSPDPGLSGVGVTLGLGSGSGLGDVPGSGFVLVCKDARYFCIALVAASV